MLKETTTEKGYFGFQSGDLIRKTCWRGKVRYSAEWMARKTAFTYAWGWQTPEPVRLSVYGPPWNCWMTEKQASISRAEWISWQPLCLPLKRWTILLRTSNLCNNNVKGAAGFEKARKTAIMWKILMKVKAERWTATKILIISKSKGRQKDMTLLKLYWRCLKAVFKKLSCFKIHVWKKISIGKNINPSGSVPCADSFTLKGQGGQHQSKIKW